MRGPGHLYTYFGWSANLSIGGGINLHNYLGRSLLKIIVNIYRGGGEMVKYGRMHVIVLVCPATIDCHVRAYHYAGAQSAVKSSYNLCSGSGPLTAIAESKHPPKIKNTKCMTPQLCVSMG